MAFHQRSPPQPLQRLLPAERRDSSNVPNRPSSQQLDNRTPTSAVAVTPLSDDPQTWVLFSPASAANTASCLGHESPITPGRSRASQHGSFRPRIPGIYGDTDDDAIVDDDDDDDDDDGDYDDYDGYADDNNEYDGDDASLAEDDAELDSLDRHLPGFRANSPAYRSAAAAAAAAANSSHRQHQHQMMPSHDGLGSFRFNDPATSADVQEQLYAHERLNKRLRRRRESQEKVERVLRGEEAHDLSREAEKMRRIEAWRLEQSRILLQEIQKLTRQRRQSQAAASSMRMRQMHQKTTPPAWVPDEESIDWHDDEAVATHHHHPTNTYTQPDTQPDGFWTRITKKVIGDLMGIDDRLLSILFGEMLPEDEDLMASTRRSAPSALAAGGAREEKDSSWHLDVLERVARELGTLVNNLSHHPGAFSTYPRAQYAAPPSSPRARLPAIPEFPAAPSQVPPSPGPESSFPYLPAFQPTRQQPSLPRRASVQDLAQSRSAAAATATGFTQDEWEQELDIKLVFRYLRSRFSSSRLSASFSQAQHHTAPSTAAASSAQDTATKSARLRQHHPLIDRVDYHRRGVFKPVPTPGSGGDADAQGAAAVPGGTSTAAATAARVRKASSCAGLNTRRPARTRRSSGSSRHYWDLGGSMGTGSVIASTGPMGSWGEV